jgi:hypothetical protein
VAAKRGIGGQTFQRFAQRRDILWATSMPFCSFSIRSHGPLGQSKLLQALHLHRLHQFGKPSNRDERTQRSACASQGALHETGKRTAFANCCDLLLQRREFTVSEGTPSSIRHPAARNGRKPRAADQRPFACTSDLAPRTKAGDWIMAGMHVLRHDTTSGLSAMSLRLTARTGPGKKY